MLFSNGSCYVFTCAQLFQLLFFGFIFLFQLDQSRQSLFQNRRLISGVDFQLGPQPINGVTHLKISYFIFKFEKYKKKNGISN